MQKRAALATAALLAFVLTACGGGGASHALSPTTLSATSTPAPAAQSAATFSLLIPNSSKTANLTRKAQCISASTLSGTVQAGANPMTELDLGVSSPLCTMATNGRSCNIAASAPVGSNITITVKLYDGAYSGGVHTGTLLSSGTFTSNVAEGAANVTVPLILAGVLSSYKIVVTQQPLMYDTTSVGTAVFDGYDAAGNLIIGSGALAGPTGSATTVALASIPTGSILYSIDGGSYGASGTIAAPGDTIAFKQNASMIGAQMVPNNPNATQLASTWVRPSGFSTQNVESTLISSSGLNQITPLVESSEGVAVVAENTPGGGIFTSNGTSATTGQCSGPIAPSADVAYQGGVAWMAAYSTDGPPPRLFTFSGSGTCSGNAQFVADTDVAINGVGVEFISNDGGTNCQIGTMVPGVYQNLGSALGDCTLVHDLNTTIDHTRYTALETQFSTAGDHILGMTGITLTYNVAVPGAAAGTIVTQAIRSDDTAYLHKLAVNKLLPFSIASQTFGASVSLPGSYTYVNNHQTLNGHAYSTRTMAIGADGLAYIAISAPVNGVLVVDPDTGTAIGVLPNASGASSSGVQQVVADKRGSIYWSAGVYLMHYPSGLP